MVLDRIVSRPSVEGEEGTSLPLRVSLHEAKA